MRLKKRNHGFTLIELLVVVAIIGLLSSIVLANVVSARQKAVATSDISTLRQIGNALNLFNVQKGTYPDAYYGVNDPAMTISGGETTARTCIGEFPCGVDNGYDTVSTQNPTILNQLLPYFSSAYNLKVHSFTVINYGYTLTVKGFWYGCYEKDDAGACKVGKLSTYIIGHVSCPSLGAQLDSTSGNKITNGTKYTICEYLFGK